jgi:4-amino-4-deoxy-L-arabinose transferase-like glycosyltransferase
MTDGDSETQAATPAPEPESTGRILRVLARYPLPVLTLLCLLLWLPGILSLPPLDRDESRFAQSSRQMLESDNFVDIRLGQVPRYKKPVGIYWLQSAVTAAAEPFVGTHRIWTYRLASLLGGVAAVWLTVWSARAALGAEAGFLAGALMAGTLLLMAEAMIATTDAVLLACTTALQGVLLRLYRAAREDSAMPSTGLVAAGWVALALGILVKGPVAPALAALTLAILCLWDRSVRWLKHLRPFLGLWIVLVIVLPWLIAITLASRGAFFAQSLGNDFAAKLSGAQESHGAAPGYYLLLSAVSFWPAILFVAPALVAAVSRRAEPVPRFLLAWGAGWWLLLELVPTYLPHYVLPAYPALAVLAASWIVGPPAERWERLAEWLSGTQFAVGAAALAAALFLLPRLYGPGDILWLWPFAGLGAILALAALVLFVRGRRGWAMAFSLVAMMAFGPAITAGAGPRLGQLWITPRLAARTVGDTRPGDPPPVLAGYQEPSMLFALGAGLDFSDGAGAADLALRDGGLALIEAREKGAFLARLAEKEGDATALETVTGFDYSRGKPVAVTIYRVAAAGR